MSLLISKEQCNGKSSWLIPKQLYASFNRLTKLFENLRKRPLTTKPFLCAWSLYDSAPYTTFPLRQRQHMIILPAML